MDIDERIPDFQVYTGAIELATKSGNPLFPELPESTDEAPIIFMVGSSTEQDLYEDTMMISALQDMCEVDPGLSIFLNHQYEIPECWLGHLLAKPVVVQKDGVTDLHLASSVSMINPRAVTTLAHITKEKARFGVSGGFMILQWHIEGDTDDWFAPIFIDHVLMLEVSICGIPANQRSWVENGIKGLFERCIREDHGEDALRLAPAYKSLYNKDYGNLIKSLQSSGLRKDLEARPMRPMSTNKLTWEPLKKHFVFTEKGGRSRIVESYKDVSTLLHTKSMKPAHKAVSGKTSWDLLALDTEWTGSKAEKEIFAYARNDDDAIVASKAKSCFLYNDPDHLDIQSGYKMAFCYVPDDTPKIVPLGVQTCANVLNGGMGGIDASDADKDGMKAKCKTIYNRINKELKPDPEWIVPWEAKDEKSMDEQKDAADGDPGRETPKASDVEVGSDGSHVACTGTHTHSHASYGSQGDDSTHEHSHPHDNDAVHDHPHEEKAVEPQTTTGIDETSTLYKAWKALGEQLGVVDANNVLQNTIDETMSRAFDHVLAIKSGQEFSKENKGYIGTIHDAITAMVGSEFCNTDASQGEDDSDTDDNNDAASSKGVTSVTQTTWLYKQFEMLVKAHEDINTGIQGLVTSLKSIPGIQDHVSVLTKQAAHLEGQFGTAKTQLNATIHDIAVLKNMPLGNPRGLERQVTPTADNGVASYQDMLNVNSVASRQWTLAECKSLTEIKTLPYGSQTITVRHWGVGIGGKVKGKGGVRPELTTAQKSHMHYNDWYEYEEGNAVDVPMIDDPFDSMA